MFQIDLMSRVPIYEQLYNNIVHLIVKQALSENEQLPSVRALAKELGVNPNTVQKAYQELERNHFIYTLTGRGNFVAKLDQKELTERALVDLEKAIREALKSGVKKKEILSLVEKMEEE